MKRQAPFVELYLMMRRTHSLIHTYLLKTGSLVFGLLVFLQISVQAQLALRLPAIISDHAVLQSSSTVKLWGWGPGGMTLRVACSWNPADTLKVPIGAECAWSIPVKTPGAGGPYKIEFTCDKQKITVDDILLGEVWLCSGQSNMEYNYKWGVSDAKGIADSCRSTKLRFFQVKQLYDQYLRSDCQGEWKVCDAKTIADFSAVGYFFGKRIYESLGTPVGMIGSYWGGTCIQAWMPGYVFGQDTLIAKTAKNIEAYGWAPKGASVLYNAMIHPLANYKIAGVLWYQGEANVSAESTVYSKLLSAMIISWRKSFGSELPFYFVQIAPWNGYEGIKAALLREQQEAVLGLNKTGMVLTGDLAEDVTDIHPKKKKTVGDRLANLALKELYGQSTDPYYPKFRSLSVKGSRAEITVDSEGPLRCREGKIVNFQVAGTDRIFYPAKATLAKDGKIVISSDRVRRISAVRYCFGNAMVPGLFDPKGMPLAPFRTDKW